MLSKLNNLLSSIIPPSPDASRPQHTLQLALAVLLIEVMRSDAESAAEEQAAVLDILRKRFNLSDTEVAQLSVRAHQAALGANDLRQFTTIINRELPVPERIEIVEYLWQVAYADGKISAHENHLMRRLVDLLHIPHGDNIAAKMRVQGGAE